VYNSNCISPDSTIGTSALTDKLFVCLALSLTQPALAKHFVAHLTFVYFRFLAKVASGRNLPR